MLFTECPVEGQLNSESYQGRRMVHFWPSANVLWFVLTCFATNFPTDNAVKTLYIGGLFPMTSSTVASAGKALLPASELAIDMVNNRSDVLPGYRLQLVWNDTKVSIINCIPVA